MLMSATILFLQVQYLSVKAKGLFTRDIFQRALAKYMVIYGTVHT